MTLDLQILKVKTGTKRVKPALHGYAPWNAYKLRYVKQAKTSGTRTGKHGRHVFRLVTVTYNGA